MLSSNGSVSRHLASRLKLPESTLRALPYLLTWTIMLLLVCSRTSFWETNDDEHMAMIAHGYGITAAPSPGLVFSNVAWGWLVSQLGVMGGFQGYALGQYGLLLLACAVICRQLYRTQLPSLLGAAAPLLMFPPAILDTEFTVTAGYTAVAGFALMLDLTRGKPLWLWLGAGALLLLASWLRLDEFVFVAMLASPFVALWLWKQADRGLQMRCAGMLAGTFALVSASMALDRVYYSGPEWQDFKQRTALAQPFIDYRLGDFYVKHPERLQSSGLSINDMQMLKQRAFMDGTVFNQASLAPLIAGVSLGERAAFNMSSPVMALRPFHSWAFDFLLVTLLAGLLAAQRLRAAPLLALAVLLGVMLFFWLWGRPGVLRIYLPATAALAVFALLTGACDRKALAQAAGLVLAMAGLWLAIQLYVEHRRESAQAARLAATVCKLPADGLAVVWGAAGPYDRDVYRPLGAAGGECPLQLYVVGGLELLPASIEKLHGYTGGKSLIDALLAGQAVRFISMSGTVQRFDMLSRYLSEHYGARLEVKELPGVGTYLAQVVRGP